MAKPEVEIRNGRLQTGTLTRTHISARRKHENEISQAKLLFLCPPVRQNYRECCAFRPEVRNSRWRPPKPEKPLSQLVDMIETKFQRLEFKMVDSRPELSPEHIYLSL